MGMDQGAASSTERDARGRAETWALAVLIAGALSIAFSPIFVRLSEIGPTATAFHRVFLALPALFLLLGVDGRRASRHRRPASLRDYAGLVLAGLFFAGDLAFWHWSIAFTTVANATLFPNMAPIFVTLAGFLFFGERFSRLFLLGLAVAVAGAVTLMGESVTVSADNLRGDVLGLVTAVFYAAYLMAVGRLRAHFSTATIMTWSTATAAIALVPVTLASGEGFLAASFYGWGVLVALALVSQVMGQSLIAYALAHLPAAFSSVSLLVQPVAAAVLGWMIFAEALGPVQAAGGAAILTGIFLARHANRRAD